MIIKPTDNVSSRGVGLPKSKDEIEIKAFIDTISDNRTNLIFYLRFICGYDWHDVAKVIGGRNTEDAVKSVCYRYLRQNSSHKSLQHPQTEK